MTCSAGEKAALKAAGFTTAEISDYCSDADTPAAKQKKATGGAYPKNLVISSWAQLENLIPDYETQTLTQLLASDLFNGPGAYQFAPDFYKELQQTMLALEAQYGVPPSQQEAGILGSKSAKAKLLDGTGGGGGGGGGTARNIYEEDRLQRERDERLHQYELELERLREENALRRQYVGEAGAAIRDLQSAQQRAREIVAETTGRDPIGTAVHLGGGVLRGTTPASAFRQNTRSFAERPAPVLNEQASIDELKALLADVRGRIEGQPVAPTLGFAGGGMMRTTGRGENRGLYQAWKVLQSQWGAEDVRLALRPQAAEGDRAGGYFQPATNEMVLNMDTIRREARQLGVTPDEYARMVMRHELAHWQSKKLPPEEWMTPYGDPHGDAFQRINQSLQGDPFSSNVVRDRQRGRSAVGIPRELRTNLYGEQQGEPRRQEGFAGGGAFSPPIDMQRGQDGVFARSPQQGVEFGTSKRAVLVGEGEWNGDEEVLIHDAATGDTEVIPLMGGAQSGVQFDTDTIRQALQRVYGDLGFQGNLPTVTRSPLGFHLGRSRIGGQLTGSTGIARALGYRPRLIRESNTGAQYFVNDQGYLQKIASPEVFQQSGFNQADFLNVDTSELPGIGPMGALLTGPPPFIEGNPRRAFPTPATPLLTPPEAGEIPLPDPRMLAGIWRFLDPATKDVLVSAYDRAGLGVQAADVIGQTLAFFTPQGTQTGRTARFG